MKTSPITKSTSLRRGFSLVEVTLAIAVAGISLFSVIGLLPTLLENDEKSGANSILPTLATQAVAEAKKQIELHGLPTDLDTAPKDKSAPNYTFHFSIDGLLTSPTDIDSVFECNMYLSRLNVVTANTAGITIPDADNHCLVTKLVFHWPSTAPANPRRTKTFHATITND